jgi:hypothetical protein
MHVFMSQIREWRVHSFMSLRSSVSYDSDQRELYTQPDIFPLRCAATAVFKQLTRVFHVHRGRLNILNHIYIFLIF